MTRTLACIIPAFDEAPRIGRVLAAVLHHPQFAEVIVVDDGSSDGTAELAEALCPHHPALRVLRMARNGGKSRAIAAGIEAARSDLVMLLDSDLVGLAGSDLSALAAPVIEGRAGAALSLRRNAPLPWRLLGIDYISGERVMPRALLAEHLDAIRALPRFGLEVFMNGLWLRQGLLVAVVPWPGVDSPFKHAKRGRLAGIAADAAMMRDIFRTVSPLQAARQIVTLRARRV